MAKHDYQIHVIPRTRDSQYIIKVYPGDYNPNAKSDGYYRTRVEPLWESGPKLTKANALRVGRKAAKRLAKQKARESKETIVKKVSFDL